ncbi:MAG: efflux transporter outer membrane subunit [Acetobacter sp.]|nr:efflux transporter outer membrane subunit [Acetobacter sp.]
MIFQSFSRKDLRVPALRPRSVTCMLVTGLLLTACDLAPDYKPAKLAFPDNWSGQGVIHYGKPGDSLPRGNWWVLFNNPELNALEEQALAANPDLAAAAEHFIQSRDIAAQAASNLYPQLGGAASGSGNKASRHRLWHSTSSRTLTYMSSEQYQAAATWEPDFWNALRNRTLIAKQNAQAVAADYATARLEITAEVASDYIALRGIDALNKIYSQSIKYYETAVEITKLRLKGDIAAGMDVSRAENQLESTRASQTELLAQRAATEHALAILVNTVPAAFHISERSDFAFTDVRPAPLLPSELLERRPDIASSERSMAQANRAIGVSRAAFYPHVTFSATTGFMDNGFDLASLSNSMYQFGAQAVLPLFQGGLRRAELQRTWSAYRQTEDEYRSTVLNAFREVEDGLTNVSLLHKATQQDKLSSEAALRTQSMSMQLYTGGLSNYLNVVVAQQDALKAQLAWAGMRTRQTQEVVNLIRALGGGWSRDELPTIKDIRPFTPLQYGNLKTPKPVGGIAIPASNTNLEHQPTTTEQGTH